MAQQEINTTTKAIIQDLIDDMQDLLKKGSNIEVAWALEKLVSHKALEKSAELIRKHLNQ